MRARIARCSTRGPCAAVSWGRQARRGIGMDADAFSPGQESCRKARLQLTNLPPKDERQAPSGVAFLFGYLSLWPHKEKVTRVPKAHESSCLCKTAQLEMLLLELKTWPRYFVAMLFLDRGYTLTI